MGMRAWAMLTVAAAMLGGCALPPALVATSAVAESTSMTATKKTVIDHVVSNAVGEDCSLVQLEEKGTYCQEKITVVRPPVYCTKTLAGVDCYDRPDPYGNGDRPLASPPPVRVTHRDKGWIDDAQTPPGN